MGPAIGKGNRCYTLLHLPVLFYDKDLTSKMIRDAYLKTTLECLITRLSVFAQISANSFSRLAIIELEAVKYLLRLSISVLKPVAVVTVLVKAKTSLGKE